MREKRGYLPAGERRQRILAAARALMARGASLEVEDLCRAAAISRATLYHYFDGPTGVRVELLEAVAARFDALLAARPTLAPHASFEPAPAEVDAAVRANLRALFSLAYEHAEPILAALHSRNTDPEADAIVLRIEDALLRALEEDLRAAEKAGLVQVPDVGLSARCLLAGIRALVEHGLSHQNDVSVDTLVDVAARLQLHGILVH